MTGTELLIETLDAFRDHGEPVAALVVWTDENGEIACKSNCPSSHAIGLAEYAKALALRTIMSSR